MGARAFFLYSNEKIRKNQEKLFQVRSADMGARAFFLKSNEKIRKKSGKPVSGPKC